MSDLTKAEFVEMLANAGWGEQEAIDEYERQMGPEGDIDGDLEE